jgi:chromosome partitioning protein
MIFITHTINNIYMINVMCIILRGRMEMKGILSIINQKGGVAKTTTSQALGTGLALKGFRVLFIDLDSQGNLTSALGIDEPGGGDPSAMSVLKGETPASAAIVQRELWGCIPSSPSLMGADMELTGGGKEYRLRNTLEPIKEKYDYIVIDTPPALGVLMVNALTASTGAIVPAQADVFSLQGIARLYSTIDMVKQYCNPELRIKGILITRYNPRTTISKGLRDMIEKTAKELDTIVYKTAIREAIAIREAQAMQQDIHTYAPKGNVSADYRAFTEEILSQEVAQ